ncbi:hypothetical protein JTB14_035856 [Gonioctena quinquepunctata]|nr:hypothetical protein JTB14_035856 [Gonioctena quinquepunctata]
MEKKLCDSTHCRLCAEENRNGTYLYPDDENSNNLARLVNRYLPITVKDDAKYPKYICPGCHIQLEATKLFMDLIVDGQSKLRNMYQSQQEKLQKEAKQKQQLENALHSVNPNSTVETYTIHTDEIGDKYLIQIYSEGPLFPPEHELALKAEGLEKPRRKRGRPHKQIIESTEIDDQKQDDDDVEENKQEESEVGEDGRKRRKIKAPSRFAGEVQGKELDKILKEEGVLDDENIPDDSNSTPEENTVIGRTESGTGEDLGEPIFINRLKMRSKIAYLRKKAKKKFACDICKKEFFHYGRCEFHKKSHNIHYVCQENCGFQNKDKSLVEQHQIESGHTGISALEKQDGIGGVLRLPEGAENAEKPPEEPLSSQYECKECSRAFSCKQNLQVHVRSVHCGEKPFECTKCDRRFSYSNSLKQHLMTHDRDDGTKPPVGYPCDKCGKVFQHPSSLLYHRDAEHSDGRRFVCTKCNKSFKHRQLLKRHQQVHSEDRPFFCNKCDANFKTHANLLNHELIHTGDKKFCCGVCGQKFSHRTSLTLHQHWHEGAPEDPYGREAFPLRSVRQSVYYFVAVQHSHEKAYRGKAVDMRVLLEEFPAQRPFKAHLRRHIDDRPFTCKFCARTFAEPWTLKGHERSHTGHRPYKCDHCDKTFSHISNKKRHMRAHKYADNVKFVYNSSRNNKSLLEMLNASEGETGKGGDLQLTQLVDQQGNPISIRTQDGSTFPIVSTGNEEESFQGLLPDGTLVPIEIANVDEKDDEGVELNLLEETSQEPIILNSDSIIQVNGDNLDHNNIQLLTDNNGQEMCLVTYAMDDNGEVSQELTVDPILIRS